MKSSCFVALIFGCFLLSFSLVFLAPTRSPILKTSKGKQRSPFRPRRVIRFKSVPFSRKTVLVGLGAALTSLGVYYAFFLKDVDHEITPIAVLPNDVMIDLRTCSDATSTPAPRDATILRRTEEKILEMGLRKVNRVLDYPYDESIIDGLISKVRGDSPRKQMIRDTFSTLKNRAFALPDGSTTSLLTPRCLIPTVVTRSFVDLEPLPVFERRYVGKMQVRVLELDTFETAQVYLKEAGKIAVINLANAQNVGGGVLRGAVEQEEELCRRSNLYLVLNDTKSSYPLEVSLTDRFQGLYSCNVSVLKDVDYSYFRHPFYVDVITIAAMHISKGGEDANFEAYTKSRCRAVLSAAAENKVDSLILGALGCGAFCNDPVLISKYFADLLEGEFSGMFENVVFGIIKNKNNIDSFKKTFKDRGFIANPDAEKAAYLLSRMKLKANLKCLRVQGNNKERGVFLFEALAAYLSFCESPDSSLMKAFNAYVKSGKFVNIVSAYRILGIEINDSI